MQPKIDGLSITALALILLLAVRLLNDASPASGASLAAQQPTLPNAPPASDLEAFAAPYTRYTITQGLHGDSYGHLAIDLGAGEGTPILSPIHGTVTGLYRDEWGNPTLTLENEIYLVTLLHGDYTVSVGQAVALSEPVGYESNLGYTTDMAGNPCWEQAGCGYHTHLNVFDKVFGVNVNPLDLLNR
jgi:murein DD-endopeptidase MepM/ murein hydrolase activator NlpD